MAGAAALAVLVAGSLGLLGWWVVYHPTLDPVPDEPVDALLVIGPLEPWRVPAAEELMRQGKARNLVLSTPNMPWDAIYCQEPHDWPAYCFPPEPSTTRGEAMNYRSLAREKGWKSVLVLTVDFHADRTRFTFERCLRTDVPVTGQHRPEADPHRRFMMVYQTAGFVKETLLGRCPA